MPQAGQRTFHKNLAVHGGNPSCWCVPRPDSAGRKRAATTSGDASNNAPANIASRVENRHFATVVKSNASTQAEINPDRVS